MALSRPVTLPCSHVEQFDLYGWSGLFYVFALLAILSLIKMA